MSYTCTDCGDWHFTEEQAERCCHCRFCGERSEYPLCEECYSERNCEGCYTIYNGENPEDGMRYGCSSLGTIGVVCEEDTLCNDCWLERQPPLTQLAGAAE